MGGSGPGGGGAPGRPAPAGDGQGRITACVPGHASPWRGNLAHRERMGGADGCPTTDAAGSAGGVPGSADGAAARPTPAAHATGGAADRPVHAADLALVQSGDPAVLPG